MSLLLWLRLKISERGFAKPTSGHTEVETAERLGYSRSPMADASFEITFL